jgi:hypothetical protein
MDSELYRIAARACQAVYQECTDLGTTEYHASVHDYRGKKIQVLAIAGTNEASDWWKNINLWSTMGIKAVAVKAAQEIRDNLVLDSDLPLLVTGHSKAGPTAIAWKRLFGARWCIAFCPARSLRYWAARQMPGTTIFIDPDDPVPRAGWLSFGHPICPRVVLPDDKLGLRISDHFMDHIINFTEREMA